MTDTRLSAIVESAEGWSARSFVEIYFQALEYLANNHPQLRAARRADLGAVALANLCFVGKPKAMAKALGCSPRHAAKLRDELADLGKSAPIARLIRPDLGIFAEDIVVRMRQDQLDDPREAAAALVAEAEYNSPIERLLRAANGSGGHSEPPVRKSPDNPR